MDIESVKSKIKKLLALSQDNKNDDESYAALQKAQELMAKYKLENNDISDEDKKQECIHKKTILGYGTRSSDHYLNDLATVIADNFCCVNYISTPRGSRTHYISFMGMEEDVEISAEALYTANNAIVKGYNRIYREVCRDQGIDYLPTKYFNPLKVGYIEGYIAGLKKAFEDQKAKHQEWGLVLVVPEEAKEFMSNLESANFNTYINPSAVYYAQGYEDGKNFHLKDKLPQGKELDKIGG